MKSKPKLAPRCIGELFVIRRSPLRSHLASPFGPIADRRSEQARQIGWWTAILRADVTLGPGRRSGEPIFSKFYLAQTGRKISNRRGFHRLNADSDMKIQTLKHTQAQSPGRVSFLTCILLAIYKVSQDPYRVDLPNPNLTSYSIQSNYPIQHHHITVV